MPATGGLLLFASLGRYGISKYCMFGKIAIRRYPPFYLPQHSYEWWFLQTFYCQGSWSCDYIKGTLSLRTVLIIAKNMCNVNYLSNEYFQSRCAICTNHLITIFLEKYNNFARKAIFNRFSHFFFIKNFLS